MNMNNLKDYKNQPDPEVWNRINRRLMVRRLALPAAAVVVVAAAVVAVAITRNDNTETVQQPVPKVVVAENINVAENAVTTEPVVAEQPRKETVTPQAEAVVFSASDEEKAVAEPITMVDNTQPAAPVANEPSRQQSEPQVVKADNKPTKTAEPVVVAEPETPKAIPSAKNTATKAPVKVNEDLLWVPNAFTPSVPGDNDHFRVATNIDTVGTIYDFRILLYNRRGAQVYESDDINFSWDGTYKGQLLPQGAYVYIIRYRDTHGEQHLQKGTVTIIR